MLLQVAAFLTALGFVTWIAGTLLGYHGIGMIGAALLVGVGAMTMTDGLETRTGEVETNTSANTTETTFVTDPVETRQTFPLGVLLTFLGGAVGVRSLEELSNQ